MAGVLDDRAFDQFELVVVVEFAPHATPLDRCVDGPADVQHAREKIERVVGRTTDVASGSDLVFEIVVRRGIGELDAQVVEFEDLLVGQVGVVDLGRSEERDGRRGDRRGVIRTRDEGDQVSDVAKQLKVEGQFFLGPRLHAADDRADGVAESPEEHVLFESILGHRLEGSSERFGKVGPHFARERLSRHDQLEEHPSLFARVADLAEHSGQVQLPQGDDRGEGGEHQGVAGLHGGILDSSGGHVLPVGLGEEAVEKGANSGDGDVHGHRRRIGDERPEAS